MLSDIKNYLAGIFKLALHSSWQAVNGLEGGLFAALATFWFGSLTIIHTPGSWVPTANLTLTFILYAAAAWIVLFLLRCIFFAPFQLWRRSRVVDAGQTRRAREIEHDKKLAMRFREIFPEESKRRLTSDLHNQHAYSDRESHMLAEMVVFLEAAETHFLNENLRDLAKELVESGEALLSYMGLKFFVYPDHQTNSPLRFAMQPNWNMDREGNGSPEQIRKYDALTKELERLVWNMSGAYDSLIKSFHTVLLT